MKKASRAEEDAQPLLVPMSAQELQLAGQTLAEKVRELEEMKREHAVEAKERSEDRAAHQAEVSAIASTIRQHGR